MRRESGPRQGTAPRTPGKESDTPQGSRLDHRCEYRVQYRRIGWSESTKTKQRIFGTRHAADAFCRKLKGDDRPDLSPIEFVRIDHRSVGEWAPC